MAGFKFKLQPVLTQRELDEQRCRRELAVRLKERNDLYAELREMQHTISASRRGLGESLVGAVDLQQVAQFARYSGQSRARAHGLVKRIALAEQQAQAARESLREATRSRKVIEVLRDKQYRRWRLEHERREAAALDEVGVQQHRRAAVEGGRA